MKKIILFLFIIINCLNSVEAQQNFKNKEYGFQIQKPNNWIEADNKKLLKNLEKFDLTEENLTKLISDNKGSILLTSFHKYDPKTHPGLIPTIQINVRSKGRSDFKQFKNSLIESTKNFKTIFENFKFVKEVSEIKISGINSLFFIGQFTMKTQDGQDLKVRSRTYAIPYKNYFFQVNFIDGQVREDCTTEFDELLKTIKIGI